MLYELEFRRIEEGKIIIDASSLEQAQRLLNVELSCGTAPVSHSQNLLIKSTELKEVPHYAS